YLTGFSEEEAQNKAKAIFALETRLAQASRKLEDLRDPYTNYNKKAIRELHTISPSIDWQTHLQEMGVKYLDSVIVGQPEFYKALSKIVQTENLQTLKDYMVFHLVRNYAPYLNKDFVNAHFD